MQALAIAAAAVHEYYEGRTDHPSIHYDRLKVEWNCYPARYTGSGRWEMYVDVRPDLPCTFLYDFGSVAKPADVG